MDRVQSTIASLKALRGELLDQLDGVDSAIKALGGVVSKGGTTGKKRKSLSPEAHKKLSDAAKKRWANHWANQKSAAKS